MHDGVYGDLWDVVNHYNFGGETEIYSGEKDPAINPLLLSDADLDNLIEFLESLEDGDSAPRPRLPRRADRAAGPAPLSHGAAGNRGRDAQTVRAITGEIPCRFWN